MKSAPSKRLKVDIVVVGAGGAGLAAAVTAAEEGAKDVVVLEARNIPGGNSVFANGFFAIDSQPKEAADIRSLKDRLLKMTKIFTHHRSDPRLVHKLIDESENTLQWLRDKELRFEWRNTTHNHHAPLYASEIGATKKTGASIIEVLGKECLERGVRILYKTRAKRLLTGETGKIVDVLAETKGEGLRISTECVILATGGFAGNKRLLKKYIPSYTADIRLIGLPNRGDGIQMAAEVGADTEDTTALEMEGPTFPWTRQLPGAFTGHPCTVWINRNGERFAEEMHDPFVCANDLNRQPGKVSYTIMDEHIKNKILREIYNLEDTFTGKDSDWGAKLGKLLRAHAEKGRINIADSWDEIAKWIGIPPTTIIATIEEYNSCCEKGYDDNFGKAPAFLLPLRHPPYYAIRCYPSLLVTHGGIRINLKMEVMDKDNNQIQGLYAAGIDTGGVDSGTYNFGLPGHSFGFALSTGRIAGKEAAKYAVG